MRLAHFVAFASVKQDTLGRRGFTRVDMRHNPDITVVVDLIIASHVLPLTSGNG